MPNVAKRLAGPVAGTDSQELLYTGPVDTVTTVQSIRVVNTDNEELTFVMSVDTDAPESRLFSDHPVPSPGLVKDSGFIVVLEAGETLYWTAASGLTVTVNGVQTT